MSWPAKGGSGAKRSARLQEGASLCFMRWRLFVTPPLDAAENMALDEALLGRARTSQECVLRVYAWSAPTLSFGRHQKALGIFDRRAAERDGISLVRRLTGGRAVLHHREVTYSVTGPAARGDTLRASYAAINGILLHALRRLGVPAALAPATDKRLPPPGSAPCFELPATGEVVLDGRKLVGSAQLRDDAAFLQHGSILIDDDQHRVAELTTAAIPASAPAATLRQALGRAPSVEEVAAALFDGVRRLADSRADPLSVDDSLVRATQDARGHYLDDLWTWRR